MSSQNHQRKKTILYLLIALLIAVTAISAFQLYKYWYTPRTIVTSHNLFVEIVTDKNLTELEVFGYLNDSSFKYVIMPKGSVTFFTLSPGINYSRQVDIKNIWNVPVDVKGEITGEITQFITMELQKSTLEPLGKGIINLTAIIPITGVSAGKYTGNLTITLTPKKT